jgi:hypothetical protein
VFNRSSLRRQEVVGVFVRFSLRRFNPYISPVDEFLFVMCG